MGETWFGHYRLERLLGSGGMGQVWLAHDTHTGRDVALKVLGAECAADPRYRRRFTREARLAAQLRGPHTVPIHSFGELDGRLYLDMEFVDGIDAAALVRRDGPLPTRQAVEIIAQAATVLDAAHRTGLVHRDIKPANLMVDRDETTYLIDFGLALRADQPAITAYGTLVGTLAYMAPERFDGIADARSDQYSLACVFYELLTGHRPFGELDTPQLMRAHLETPPPRVTESNPAVPEALNAIIARGMAKDPDERWPSAGEFAAAAYVAVTGRDAATVELSPSHAPMAPAATTGAPEPQTAADSAGAGLTLRESSTPMLHPASRAETARTVPGKRWRTGAVVSYAALAALLAVIGGALWFGQPSGSDAATPAISLPDPSTTDPGRTPTGAAHPPVGGVAAAPVPQSNWTPAPPSAGQPCNPALDGMMLGLDGAPLECISGASGVANWGPSESRAGDPTNDPGQGNSGNGNSQNGNLGSVDSGGVAIDGAGNGNGDGNGTGSGNGTGNGAGTGNGSGHGNGNGHDHDKPDKGK